MTLFEVAQELFRRLAGTFLREWASQEAGQRPVYGGTAKFQDDPHWRDLILFYEYFHGDNGAGLGASHQTGWTGLVARLLDLFGRLEAKIWRSSANSVRPGCTGASGWGTDEREVRGEYVRSALSCAVPNQHPRLADGIVPETRQARHTG